MGSFQALMHTRIALYAARDSTQASAAQVGKAAKVRRRVPCLTPTARLDSFGLVATSSSAAKVRRSDTIDIGMAESRPGL